MMVSVKVLFQLYPLYVYVSAVSTAGLADINSCEFHEPVPNRYIVKLRRRHTLENHFKYINVSRGHPHIKDIHDHTDFIQSYSGSFPEDLVDKMRTDPGVERVTQDHFMRPSRIEIHREHNTSVIHNAVERPSEQISSLQRRRFPGWSATSVQRNAPWNLALLSDKYIYPSSRRSKDYLYLKDSGKDVNIYVIGEGGIDETYGSLRGRVVPFSRSDAAPVSSDSIDIQGTYLASIAAGKAFGVAKSATIVYVREVFTLAGLIRALHVVVEQHNWDYKYRRRSNSWKGSVVLTEFSSDCEVPELWQAVRNAATAGIVIVADAGTITNEADPDEPQRPTYPCAYFGVFCVASMTRLLTLNDTSKFGSHVNIMAPAADIRVGPYSEKRKSFLEVLGAAAPQLAGVIAMFVGNEGLARDVPKVLLRIKNNAKLARAFFNIAETANVLPTYILNNGLGSSDYWQSQDLYYKGVEPPSTHDTRRFRRAGPSRRRLSRRYSTPSDVDDTQNQVDNGTAGLERRSHYNLPVYDDLYTCTSDSALGDIQDTETIMYGLDFARGQKVCYDASPTHWLKPQAIGACSGGLCPYLKVHTCRGDPPSYEESPLYSLPPGTLDARGNDHEYESVSSSASPTEPSRISEPEPTHTCFKNTIVLRDAAERIYKGCRSRGILELGERVAGWSVVEGSIDECSVEFGIANGDDRTNLPEE